MPIFKKEKCSGAKNEPPKEKVFKDYKIRLCKFLTLKTAFGCNFLFWRGANFPMKAAYVFIKTARNSLFLHPKKIYCKKIKAQKGHFSNFLQKRNRFDKTA
jgi:hypothetical protein